MPCWYGLADTGLPYVWLPELCSAVCERPMSDMPPREEWWAWWGPEGGDPRIESGDEGERFRDGGPPPPKPVPPPAAANAKPGVVDDRAFAVEADRPLPALPNRLAPLPAPGPCPRPALAARSSASDDDTRNFFLFKLATYLSILPRLTTYPPPRSPFSPLLAVAFDRVCSAFRRAASADRAVHGQSDRESEWIARHHTRSALVHTYLFAPARTQRAALRFSGPEPACGRESRVMNF